MGWVPLQMISVTILTLALAPGLTGSSPAPGCVSCRYSMIATLWVRVSSEHRGNFTHFSVVPQLCNCVVDTQHFENVPSLCSFSVREPAFTAN